MCIHDPKRRRCWFDLADDRDATHFMLKFREVVSELAGAGAIRPVKFEEVQVIVTPAMIEAAEIVMNAPMRRPKLKRPEVNRPQPHVPKVP